MSITTAPASTLNASFTVTAEIDVPRYGDPFLRVTVDGEAVTVRINPHLLRLHGQSVTDEAERLLQRHAGYRTTTGWATDERGRMTATVAEISGRCVTCVHGCGCSIDAIGCGHYQCLAASAEIAHTCDGAALAVNAKRPALPRRPRNPYRRGSKR
ncbi:hypothetical protein [Actinoplanes sp. NPDC026623]|uniref:hypothetical protein n=1 Tax=Actinoplanes sp. NPDC026623 TaxID=3155610 RepID=UPI0033D36F19